MKKTFPFLCLIGSIILCNSCSESEETIITENESKAIKIINTQDYSKDTLHRNLIAPFTFTTIQTKDSLYLTGRNKLVFHNGKYFLADFQLSLLLLLDSTGREISKIGDIGSGAGHFLSIEDFNFDYYRNQILVFSNEGQSLTTFSHDGKLIEKKRLDFFAYGFSILDSNHLIFFLNQNTNKKSGKFNLLVTDRSCRILQRLFPTAHLPDMVVSYSGFIQRNDSAILYSEPLSDSIYEIKNGVCTPKYYIGFGDKVVPYSRNLPLAKIQDYTMKYNWINGPVYESEKYILLKYHEAKKIHGKIVNRITGKTVNSRDMENKLLHTLLYNVSGQKNDVFYSIINSDLIYPVLNEALNPKDVRLFNSELYKELRVLAPSGKPIICAFKFNF